MHRKSLDFSTFAYCPFEITDRCTNYICPYNVTDIHPDAYAMQR